MDLPEFILANRERLTLRPNEDGTGQSWKGADMDASAWERALKTASRNAYVVQEVVEPALATFPVNRWGSMEMTEMRVDVQPHIALGRVNGCSSWVSPAGPGSAFSSLAGLAPTFILGSGK